MKTPTKKSEHRQVVKDYISKYNPYQQVPKLGYNVAAMSRYATEHHRKISELSEDEVALFSVG